MSIATKLISQANLPASIPVISGLSECIAVGSPSTPQIAEVIKIDSKATDRLLAFANAPYYNGKGGGVRTVELALTLIGVEEAVHLIIASEVMNIFSKQEFYTDIIEFWKKNVFAAVTAKCLAKKLSGHPARFFTSTLLRGIGHFIFYRAIPDKIKPIIDEYSQNPAQPLFTMEQEKIGIDHAELGSILLDKWELPHRLTQAIRFYNDPLIRREFWINAAVIHLSQVYMNKHFGVMQYTADEDLFTLLTQIPDEALLKKVEADVLKQYEPMSDMISKTIN